MDVQTVSQQMYRFCGLSQDKLVTTLKGLDPKTDLEKIFRSKWTPENPFYGYSNYIAEFVYFYVAPKGAQVKRLWCSNGKLNQYIWFVQWPDSTLVDLSLPQHKEIPDYSGAKLAKLKTGKPQLTTKKIAAGLGFSDEDLDV